MLEDRDTRMGQGNERLRGFCQCKLEANFRTICGCCHSVGFPCDPVCPLALLRVCSPHAPEPQNDRRTLRSSHAPRTGSLSWKRMSTIALPVCAATGIMFGLV